MIDPRRQTIQTVAGDAQPGSDDDPPRFNEPAGLSFAADKLYVADTNNHKIRVIDIANDFGVSTLEIRNLKPPTRVAPPAPTIPRGITHRLGRVEVAPVGNQLRLAIRLYLPSNVTLNNEVPMSYLVKRVGGDAILDSAVLDQRLDIAETGAEVEVELPLVERNGKSSVSISLAYFYCEQHAKSLCKIGNITWNANIELNRAARRNTVTLEHTVR